MGIFLIISLTIASSGPLTLLSLSLALACNTSLRPSSVNCCFPFFLKYSILEVFNSFCLFFSCLLLISVHLFTMSLKLFLPSSLSSVKCPFTYSSVSGFLRVFFFLGSKLHFTRCSALALLACFLSVLLLIFAVHLAAASSCSLTWHSLEYSLLLFLFVLSFGALLSWPRSQCSSVQLHTVVFHHFFFEFQWLLFCYRLPSRPLFISSLKFVCVPLLVFSKRLDNDPKLPITFLRRACRFHRFFSSVRWCNPVSKFISGLKCLCVNASALPLPRTDHEEDTLQSNSFTIPYLMFF